MSDWDNVTVIRKRAETPKTVKSDAALNAARRSGASIETAKKGSGSNATAVYDAGKMAKVDNETEDFHVEKVSMSVSRAIQQGRQAKGLTQKQLATMINEKPTIVNDYEGGRAPNPNQQVLAKMERVLGLKLRGKNIGEPLGSK
ncbi:multi protein bridging factor 1-domain-containing protein [Polychytrium aggregatum]|uniref:multi protein bridging factor 1-domain-containing protein n=1 Tax=Polychytrium aggregatum TaxID=110093 RepID=UPI0022FEDE37|nr:multi protein bridging factor 1-domain-containing protein [Polychytrium aggregatum]KAI9203877.1 multi protein bridging factor 1-domain-containing protein [Polychytrium aggregatum]